MKKIAVIKPLVSALMLLVFALAITPKRFLHNLIADHRDAHGKLTSDRNEFTKAGFNCQIDNLVATSPFTDTNEKLEITLSFIFILQNEKFCFTNLFPAHIYFSLRGPPGFLPV